MRQTQKKTMQEHRRQAIIAELITLGIHKIADQGIHNLDYSELKWHLALEHARKET